MGRRGYNATDEQSTLILPSFGSAAAALQRCLCVPGPGLASLLFTNFPQVGSVSSLVLLLSWHPSSPALSDPGSDPGKNMPLKNAPDNLQGYLAANPLYLRGLKAWLPNCYPI